MAHSKETKKKMSESQKLIWQARKLQLEKAKEVMALKAEELKSEIIPSAPEPMTEPNKLVVVSRRETFKRDFNGATLATVNVVLRSIYSGYLNDLYDWYDYLLNDPHILAVSQLRSSWVAGKKIKVIPADDSPEAAKAALFIKRELDKIPFLTLAIKKLLHAVFTGLEVSEIVWKWNENDYCYSVDELATINPKKLYYTTDTMELKVSQRYGLNALNEDFKLDDFPGKFILHSPLTVARYIQQSGLFYYISYRFLFRAIVLQYGMAGLERFAFPWMYAQVPMEMEEQNRYDLISMLDALANDASAVFDQNVELKTIEASITTSEDSIITGMLKYFADEISKVALGGTTNLESAADGNTYAQSKVHAQNSINIFQEDAQMICETLEAYVVRYLLEYNIHLFDNKIPPFPKLEIDVQEYPRLDQIGVQYGKVSVNEVRRQYGLAPLLPKDGGNDDAFRTKTDLAGLIENQTNESTVEGSGETPETGDHKQDQFGIEELDQRSTLETKK